MSLKNLALDVESIALALSEEGGYEHYHIDDDLRELAKDVSDMQAENAKLRKLLLDVWNDAMQFDGFWDYVNDDGEIYNEDELPHYYDRMRELGLEVR